MNVHKDSKVSNLLNEIAALSRVSEYDHAVKIMAVIKNRTPDEIDSIAQFDMIDTLGENRLDSAKKNWQEKSPQKPLHFIGHLQTNKVKEVLTLFDVIESVDSRKLVDHINKEAIKQNKVQKILLRINPLAEQQKDGFTTISQLQEIVAHIATLSHISVLGAMTMAPDTKDDDLVRKCFALTRRWWLQARRNDMGVVLSMGMTQDYKIAIEEGSTQIRLGRILFDEL